MQTEKRSGDTSGMDTADSRRNSPGRSSGMDTEKSRSNLSAMDGEKSSSSTPGRIKGTACRYLLLPGEKGTCFAEFVKGLSTDIMTDDLPKEQTAMAGAPGPAMFKQEGQQVLFNVINMVLDIIESGSCFERLHEDMVAITEDFEVPRLLEDNLKGRTDGGVKKNLFDLADMLHRVVYGASGLYRCNKNVNPEFKDLLGILKSYKPGDDFFVLRYPACNCPLPNRCHLFVTMYDFTMHVLRFTDQEAYIGVMTGLCYPLDWYLGLQDNSYLVKQCKKGKYDFEAKEKKTDPRLEPLRLVRNNSAHPYEGTGDANAPHGITWSREDLGHVFYYIFPELTSSMQISLSFLGELQHLNTQHLFAYCVKKKTAAE